MLFKKVFFEIISTQFLLQFSKLFPNLSFLLKLFSSKQIIFHLHFMMFDHNKYYVNNKYCLW